MKRKMMTGRSVNEHHKKMDNLFKQKKMTREKVGGFIFPLVGHIIKAVRSNNAHKERVKQGEYNKTEEGKMKRLKEIEEQGKMERAEKQAYEKGLSGKGVKCGNGLKRKKLNKIKKMIN